MTDIVERTPALTATYDIQLIRRIGNRVTFQVVPPLPFLVGHEMLQRDFRIRDDDIYNTRDLTSISLELQSEDTAAELAAFPDEINAAVAIYESAKAAEQAQLNQAEGNYGR